MLSVGSVGVRPLTHQTGKVAFRGNDDLEEQREGVEELREMSNSQDTPKLIRNTAKGALLIGVGALGYATFDKCAPKAWDAVKKSYNKALSPKNKEAVAKNLQKATSEIKEQVKKLDGKLLTKAEEALGKAEKGSKKEKFLSKALDVRNSAKKSYHQATDWAKNKGPTWLRKTMAVLTGGASAIETHQEMTENEED